MGIKDILDEIRIEPSTNNKKKILARHTDNETLKRVLYLAKSKRIKFGIKKIPEYTEGVCYPKEVSLDDSLILLNKFTSKEVSGNAAADLLRDILEHTSPDNASVIKLIIAKDLKIGMGTTEMNKVIGTNFIEKTPYQGAKSYSEKLARDIISKGRAMSQIKMDGRYNNAILLDGVHNESRGGEPVYLEGAKFLTELNTIAKDFNNIVFNGEFTIDNVPRYLSNGIIASCISITKKRNAGKDVSKELKKLITKHGMTFEQALENIRFTVWDIITTDEYVETISSTPYDQRFNLLTTILEEYQPSMISIVEYKWVYSFKDAFEHFQEALDRGLEGTILKEEFAIWKNGKPDWQIKMKLEMHVELEIVAVQYGKVGTKNEHVVSSLIVKSSCGKVNTRTANMKEADMDYITEHQDDLIGAIITGKSCGLSQNSAGEWALLHPVFIEIRTDKTVADSLEQIQEIENASKLLS